MSQHIILLHGALGSASQFKGLEDKLNKEYNVHVFDFIGHGGSKIPAEIIMPQLVDQLQDYIVNNIPVNDKLIIFGYSMGGYAALLLAAKNVCTIHKIITLGTKLNWTEEIATKEITMLNPEVIEQKVPAFAEEQKTRHHPEDWKLLMNRTADMMMDLGKNQYLNETVFKNLEVPCKLLLGDKDKMVTREETELADRWIKNSEFILLPDTPHPIEKVNLDLLVTELYK